jgi:putative oxidoreductase
MTTHVTTPTPGVRSRAAADAPAPLTRYLVPIGRALFVGIFLWSTPHHFSAQSIARAARQGMPLASLAVPLSGVLALVGALSLLLGYRARVGAWLLVLFLVPVTLTMHNFWAVSDPTMAQIQLVNFMKNLSMLGGALLLAHFGAGPVSIDARQGR